MQAIDRELLSVLSDATIRFVVPVYQRRYAWQEENWKRLWDDILAIAQKPDKEHFTGSIVWVGNLQGPSGHSDGNVLVDGQQRLTTLSLAILAYAEFAKAHDNKASNGNELPVSYRKILGSGYLLSDYEEGELRYKITLSDVDREMFRALIEGLVSPCTPIPDQESPLLTALEYFRTRIAEMEDQSVFWRGIERLRIVNVTLDPHRDNPQLVFETMNSTGKPLTHADLIRNYILLGLPVKIQSRLYRNYWRQMELVLGTDRNMDMFDQFIFHYLTLYMAPNIVTQTEIYQIFKRYREEWGEDTEGLLQEMLFHARIYAAITVQGAEKDAEIGRIFRKIVTLKATPVIPLIMFLYAQWKRFPDQVSREDFVTAIRYLETYLVYRTLCDYRNNSLSRYVPSLIAKFQESFAEGKSSVAKQLLATFEDEKGSARAFPSQKQVLDVLMEKDFYGMATFRKKFFLEQLENALHPKNWLDISGGSYSIEHIMPQTIDPHSDWPAMLGDDYEITCQDYLHLLGNLTITAYNSELSNLSFAKKKEAYLASEPIALSNDVLQEEVWTYEKIKARTERLARRIIALWPRPYMPLEKIRTYSLLRRKTEATTEYITVRDLIQAGVLLAGEKLVSHEASIYKGATCHVNEDGKLQFDDGRIEDYPSGAAMYAIAKLGKRLKSMNGWWFWFVPRLNCRLSEVKNFLDSGQHAL